MMIIALACTLVAIDGDTLRCGRERIRLIGIDAPELPGHCRKGRRCAPGDPVRAKRSLSAAIRGRATITRVGFDHYGRTIAAVRVNGRDLSCHQLASGNAIYVRRWDAGKRVGKACASATVRAQAKSSEVHSGFVVAAMRKGQLGRLTIRPVERTVVQLGIAARREERNAPKAPRAR